MTKLSPALRLATATAIGVASAVTAVPALAGGEPKNQVPFTRIAVARALTQQLTLANARTSVRIRGEAKNELPFTRR